MYVFDEANNPSGGYAVTIGGSDTTPPTVTSATIASDGQTVTVQFSETVVTTGYTSGDMDLDCASAGTDISLSSPVGSGSGRDFTVATTIQDGDSCTLDHNGATDSIEDGNGNDLAAIVDAAVTNNSVQGAVTGRIIYDAGGPRAVHDPTGPRLQ
jgi:hypothetical protein